MQEDEYKPLLDRDKLAVEVKQYLSSHIDLLHDVTNYGTLLIPRSFVSSKRTLKDLIVIAVLLRQVVTMLDALELLLSHGAVYASNLQLRAIFEAAVYIQWILDQDGDKKALYYYVHNLRRRRSWAARLLPGSAEAQDFADLITARHNDAELQQVRGAAKEEIGAIDKHLSKPEYAPINQQFEQLRKKRGHEVSWYTPFGIPSFRKIAADAGKRREYLAIYGGGSEAMHASNYKQHLVIGRGEVTFEPIRHLQGFDVIAKFALTLVFEVYRRILSEYRHGELTLFGKKYVEKWQQAFLNVPRINYQCHSVKI